LGEPAASGRLTAELDQWVSDQKPCSVGIVLDTGTMPTLLSVSSDL
jgi:hypothetical protein